MTPELLHRSRLAAARTVLDAPVLSTPLLDRLRRNHENGGAWIDIDLRYTQLSGGEQIVFGWLEAAVWTDHSRSEWTWWDSASHCMAAGDYESARAIVECAETLLALGRVELGLAEVAA